MKRSRLLRCCLGLMATALCATALGLSPRLAEAACFCPMAGTWSSAPGIAYSTAGCPGSACLDNARANAEASCDNGVCAWGSSSPTSCVIIGGQYRSTCSVQYKCF
ncbi:MAG TPA: hypothetical protein VEL74_12950, partial [Thermoanaerobaculia bacterium]|nr:hypothetical protein [Thermoanaerobaculia bacterium]